MSDENTNIKQLFQDIINKLNTYDRMQADQSKVLSDVQKIVDRLNDNIQKVSQINFDLQSHKNEVTRELENISEKTSRIETKVENMGNIVYKLDLVHDWKKQIDSVVTAEDLKSMKNNNSIVKELERKITDLKNELREEKNKSSILSDKIQGMEIEVESNKRIARTQGAGAGALVAGATSTAIAVVKGMLGN